MEYSSENLGSTLLDYAVLLTTIVAVGSVVWMMVVKPHLLHPLKRVGLALIGSGLLMNSATIIGGASPFTDWTPIISRIGVIILVLGYGLDHHLFPRWGRLNQWSALIEAADVVKERKQCIYDNSRKIQLPPTVPPASRDGTGGAGDVRNVRKSRSRQK